MFFSIPYPSVPVKPKILEYNSEYLKLDVKIAVRLYFLIYRPCLSYKN